MLVKDMTSPRLSLIKHIGATACGRGVLGGASKAGTWHTRSDEAANKAPSSWKFHENLVNTRNSRGMYVIRELPCLCKVKSIKTLNRDSQDSLLALLRGQAGSTRRSKLI
jgi:hypothetical protein